MSRKYDVKLFQEEALKQVHRATEELDFPKIYLEATNKGNTNRTQLLKIEYQRFDSTWLDNLETFFPSLMQITKDLKSALRYEEEILPIEKTRRTNPEAIRHLLRNTRYIRDVTDDGQVIPEKVLNTLSNVDYSIYENRFIMTLVDRLYNYLLKRIETIRENITGSKEMHFNMQNNFNFGTTNYDVDVKIKSSEDIDIKDIDLHNYSIYEKANDAFKIISRIYFGDYMKVMKKYEKVKAPILKTQVILKNPNFRNAYLLWLYLDRLHVLDFTLQRKIKKVEFNDSYNEQLDKSLLMLFSTVFINSDIDISDKNVISENVKPLSNDLEYVSNIDTTPVPYDLEPNLATEYQLKKAKQLFNKQYNEIARNNESPVESLKQVLLDQYSIGDQIFNYYFETDQDDDVFDKLINYANPVRKYKEAIIKYDVTKTAREVKEKLFRDSLKLESKWIKEASIYQREAIAYITEREFNENEKELNTISRSLEKDLSVLNKTLKDNTKEALKKQRMRNQASINKLKIDYRDNLKEFREKERARVKLAKEKLKERNKVEKEKLRNKQLAEKRMELEKSRLKRANDQKALRARLAKDKEKLKMRSNKQIDSYKEKLK